MDPKTEWKKLTREERRDISLEFLQCEGCTPDGHECQTLGEYYEYTRLRIRLEREPYDAFDLEADA